MNAENKKVYIWKKKGDDVMIPLAFIIVWREISNKIFKTYRVAGAW